MALVVAVPVILHALPRIFEQPRIYKHLSSAVVHSAPKIADSTAQVAPHIPELAPVSNTLASKSAVVDNVIEQGAAAAPRAVLGVPSRQDQQWATVLKIAKQQRETGELIRNSGIPSELNLPRGAVDEGMLHYASIPQSKDEFEHVFGVRPKDEVIADTKETAKALRAYGAAEVPSTPETLESLLSARREKIVTFTGHNEDGQLRLTDGSKLPLQAMATICARTKKICIFLSCSSRSYVGSAAVGVPLTLTYNEASRLLSFVVSFHRYAFQAGATYSDFAGALPVILAVENIKYQGRVGIRYISPIAAVSAGLFVISIVDRPPTLTETVSNQLMPSAKQ